MNDTTKKLTGWAAIIAVPTLITGFFRMNVPYPGFCMAAVTAEITASSVMADRRAFPVPCHPRRRPTPLPAGGYLAYPVSGDARHGAQPPC